MPQNTRRKKCGTLEPQPQANWEKELAAGGKEHRASRQPLSKMRRLLQAIMETSPRYRQGDAWPLE